MDTGLKGKTVLITGASRNMGRKSSLAFAQEGANLVICAHAKIKELNETAAEARALGVKVLAELCDVTDSTAVNAFVKKACDQFGGIDPRLPPDAAGQDPDHHEPETQAKGQRHRERPL